METLKDRLRTIIAPVLEEEGYDMVDFKIGRQGRRWLLRVFADKKGGITLAQCTALSKLISDQLDLDDPIQESYILEVSSPGLERPLKTADDFRRKIGKSVVITYQNDESKNERLEGIIVDSTNDTVCLEEQGHQRAIRLDSIVSARLVV